MAAAAAAPRVRHRAVLEVLVIGVDRAVGRAPLYGERTDAYCLMILAARDANEPAAVRPMPFAAWRCGGGGVAAAAGGDTGQPSPAKRARGGGGVRVPPPAPPAVLPYRRAGAELDSAAALSEAATACALDGGGGGEYTVSVNDYQAIALPCTSPLVRYTLLVTYSDPQGGGGGARNGAVSCTLESVIGARSWCEGGGGGSYDASVAALLAYACIGRNRVYISSAGRGVGSGSGDASFALSEREARRIADAAAGSRSLALPGTAARHRDAVLAFALRCVAQKRAGAVRWQLQRAVEAGALAHISDAPALRAALLGAPMAERRSAGVRHFATAVVLSACGASQRRRPLEAAATSIDAVRAFLPDGRNDGMAMVAATGGAEADVWPPSFWLPTIARAMGSGSAETAVAPACSARTRGFVDALMHVYAPVVRAALEHDSTRITLHADRVLWAAAVSGKGAGADAATMRRDAATGVLHAFGSKRAHIDLSAERTGDDGNALLRLGVPPPPDAGAADADYVHTVEVAAGRAAELRLASAVAAVVRTCGGSGGPELAGEACTWSAVRERVDKRPGVSLIAAEAGVRLYSALAQLFIDADNWTFVVPSAQYWAALVERSNTGVGSFARARVLPHARLVADDGALERELDIVAARPRFVLLGVQRYGAAALAALLERLAALRATSVVLVGDVWARPRHVAGSGASGTPSMHAVEHVPGAPFTDLVAAARDGAWANVVAHLGADTPLARSACGETDLAAARAARALLVADTAGALLRAMRDGPHPFNAFHGGGGGGGGGAAAQAASVPVPGITLWLPDPGVPCTAPAPRSVVLSALVHPVFGGDGSVADQRERYRTKDGSAIRLVDLYRIKDANAVGVGHVRAAAALSPALAIVEGELVCATSDLQSAHGAHAVPVPAPGVARVHVYTGRNITEAAAGGGTLTTLACALPLNVLEAVTPTFWRNGARRVRLFQEWSHDGGAAAEASCVAALRRALYELVGAGASLGALEWVPVVRRGDAVPLSPEREVDVVAAARDARRLLTRALTDAATTSVPRTAATGLRERLADAL